MRRAVIVVFFTAFLASAASASVPRLTASGNVAALSGRSITVHGRSCRITSASPARSVLRLYYVGASVKIACANGVLRSIQSLHQPAMITVGGSATPGGGGGSFAWGTDVTAQGTITSLSSDGCTSGTSIVRCGSITVNGVSCAVSLPFYNLITAGLAQPFSVGDTATMQCDPTGSLIAIGHNGI